MKDSGLVYLLNLRLEVARCSAVQSSLIGAGNVFELAAATAIGLFGIHSSAALATVVEVLSEAPLMLFVVGDADRTQH